MNELVVWVIENWAYMIAWIFEFLVVLLCIYGIFGEKFRFDKYNILLMILDNVIFCLIWGGILSKIFTIVIYVALFVYCIKTFKKKFIETVGRFVLSFIVVGAIEIVAAYIITLPLENQIMNRGLLMLMTNGMSLLLSIFAITLMWLGMRKIHVILNDNKIVTMIIISGMSMLFMMFDYRYYGVADLTYYLVYIVLMVTVYFYWAKMQKAQFELEKKKIELKLQNVYGNAYSELIFEVRRKQHDFMNQLSALYSMHLTATSLEDLIEKQKEYGDVLVEQCRYDKILTGCNNSILAGYLYYKCVNFEKSHVVVEYTVHVDTAECSLSLHELIEILGILLTNAFESIENITDTQKIIHLTVEESAENLAIKVENSSPYVTSREIEKYFEKGYSSKGENRGLGLARVKQLTQKCGAELVVENHTISENNQISFRVIIPK